ncbi:MAG: hypothetical protein LM578_02750 [Desulfurococcaceae archaeon]|jgi:hypothetical protein|nr:hypothetical protein [Desulfurococcaceae archaeon]
MAVKPLDLVGVIRGYMIETQVYCEAKLHYMITSRGEEVRVTEGEARRLVEETLRLLRTPRGRGIEFLRAPISARFNEAYITLSPDAIVYVDGSIAGLLEARIRGDLRYYDSDFVTLEVGGLLLEELLGVELGTLKLVLIVARSREGLREALEETNVNPFKPERRMSWVRVTRVYNRGESISKLSHLLEYWLGMRGFKPRPSPFKCRVCEYSSMCPARVMNA